MRFLVLAAAVAALLTYVHATSLAYRPELSAGWQSVSGSRLPETIERAEEARLREVSEGRAPTPYRHRVLVPWLHERIESCGLEFWQAWVVLSFGLLFCGILLFLRAAAALAGDAAALVAGAWFALWVPVFGISGSVAAMCFSWFALAAGGRDGRPNCNCPDSRNGIGRGNQRPSGSRRRTPLGWHG